jgi:hypothetical protein
MSLSTGSGQLQQCLKDLLLHWDDAKMYWTDPVSQAFEKDHCTPLQMQILATLRGIQRLAHALDQAKRDCG